MKHRKSLFGIILPILLTAIVIASVSADETPVTKQLIREKIREGMSIRTQELERAREMGLPIRGEMPGGGLFELKTLSTRVPTYFITNNEAAARSTRTDSVQAVFGGAPGVTLGIWDGGAARVTHREMYGRATWGDRYSYRTHPHSTHVGATMIGAGIDPAAKGMSYEADLVSYEWSFDNLEAELEAQQGLTLSNHSYGHGRGWVVSSGSVFWYGDVDVSETEDYLFGFYSETSREWDEVADRNPGYLPVTSAGNDRNDSVPPGTSHSYWNPLSGGWVSSTAVRDNDGGELGYDCIPDGLSTAKNTLVIGAVVDVEEYLGPESVEITEFSSWGPTDDGRIKPDICGNGYRLYSALDGSDEAYGIYSGTSMASPNVCGSLGLLQAKHAEMYGRYMLGATVKALAIATAREAGPHPGPDYGFGWGLLDTWAAYEVIESDPDGRKGTIVEIPLNDGRPLEFYYTPLDGAERMTFTIAWADPPAEVPAPVLNDRTPVLVDDLDIRVTGAGGEHLPWILDPDDPQAPAGRGDNIRDNVEQIIIENPVPGTYLVKIDHKGSLRDGDQHVSMIVTGAERTRTWHIFADGSGDAATIKEAVELAEPGDQIFVFNDPQIGGTFNESDITIDKQLLIRGIGEPLLTSGNQGRFFRIVPPGAGLREVNVDIEGFRFFDCSADRYEQDERGGAIFCGDVQVALTSCSFEGCGAEKGGAVFCDGGQMSISFCAFEDCVADEGGAVYLRESRSVLENCLFHDNDAQSGGGIFMLRSDAILRRGTMSSNRAANGGAIFLETSSPVINNCTLTYNQGGPGSGIFISGGGRPRIAASIVAFGIGSAATGIHATDYSSHPSVGCCDVYGNEEKDYSGSLGDMTGSQGNISEDPLFCEQDTGYSGEYTVGDGSPCIPNRNGCLVMIGASGVGCHTLTKMRITPEGTGDLPTVSAAMLVAGEGDTIILAPGIFTGPGNRDISAWGRRVIVTSEAGAGETVIDCSVGGGSYYGFYFGSGEDTTTVLEGVTVKGAGDGGVICNSGSSPLIRDCRFIECMDGGIIVEANSRPIFRRCVISDNTRNPNGGGVYIRSSAPVFEDCQFTGNTATSNGGAIATGATSHPVIRRCLISDNNASADSGGGIYSIMGTATIEDCVITGNVADYGGGGIFSGTNATIEITGTLIAGNSSTSIGGGVYSAVGMTMSHCTVVDNYTGNYGAGIEVFQGPNNHIDNSIIAFNRNVEGVFTISGDIDITCSDVYGNEGGNYGGSTADMTGPLNLSVDPLFCDTAGGDWYLSADSPVLTPPDQSCGDIMGALGVRCGDSADLLFSSVVFDTMSAAAGRTIHAAAVVRNNGPAGTGSFRVDFYSDLDDSPEWGSEGDWYETVDTLASGDSVSITFDISSPAVGMWRSWLMIDTDGMVPEYNRENNTAGPYAITWTSPGGIVPDQSKISSLSPNPFGAEMEIVYDLDRLTAAEISIYDLTGRRLKIWKLPAAGPGRFTITWPGTTDDGRQISSGVYFLRFRVDGVVEQGEKIVRIR